MSVPPFTRCLSVTRSTGTLTSIFDDSSSTWRVETEPGAPIMARFVVLATGPLSMPNVPDVPGRDTFDSAESYYSTLFHELTHSTGHTSRLAREGIERLERFGSESYSKEELVAEIGAAMLCGVAGIARQTVSNSASYLQSWLRVLKADSRLVIGAASAAQRAADYILGKAQGDGRAA